MILQQNNTNMPKHSTISPLCSSPEYSYVKKIPNNTNSRPTSLNQWKNFLSIYIDFFDNIKISEMYLTDKLLISLFNFNKYIEIQNIDLCYLLNAFQILETIDYSKLNISPESFLGYLLKCTLMYSKSSSSDHGELFRYNVYKNIKKYFNTSDDDFEKYNQIIPESSIINCCKNMNNSDYLNYLAYLNCASPQNIVEFKYLKVEKNLKNEEEPVDLVQNFAARDMTYLKNHKTFFKMFKKKSTFSEIKKLIDNILEYSNVSDSYKNYYKFLLINEFIVLDYFLKFKSVEINSAQIYLKRLIKNNGIPKNSDGSIFFLALLSLSLYKFRNIPLENLQQEFAYITDLKNPNLLENMLKDIIEHIFRTSRSLFDISYAEYVKHLKSNYKEKQIG